MAQESDPDEPLGVAELRRMVSDYTGTVIAQATFSNWIARGHVLDPTWRVNNGRNALWRRSEAEQWVTENFEKGSE